MSDFNAAYSYQPTSYNQHDYQSQGNGQSNQYGISDQGAYDNFFKSNGIAATDEQRQNSMDFANSLGFSKDSPLGACPRTAIMEPSLVYFSELL